MRVAGIQSYDPTEKFHAVKQEKKLPTILSGKEVDRLLKIPDVNTPKGCRDKAMLELLYATGMRVSELIDLNLDDIQINRSVVSCRSGNVIRSIPIYSAAKKATATAPGPAWVPTTLLTMEMGKWSTLFSQMDALS